MQKLGQRIRRALFFMLAALCLAASMPGQGLALPRLKRVNSVKSLTNILSQVEEENGDRARYATLKLQVYLEDLYISVGTAVSLKPLELSKAIRALLEQGVVGKEMGKVILRRYKDGEFHE